MPARKTTRPTARPAVTRTAKGPTKAPAKSGAPIRIYSWNVNGIRSAVSKGLVDWLATSRAEIVGLQEVRAGLEAIPGELADLSDYHQHYVAATKKGYSGVGLRISTTRGACSSRASAGSSSRMVISRTGRARIAATIASRSSSTGIARSSSASRRSGGTGSTSS
jgi:exonuclease III